MRYGALSAAVFVVVAAACGFPDPPTTPRSETPFVAPAQSPGSVDSIPPSPTALPTLAAKPEDYQEVTCVNSAIGYELTYPASWFVHPPAEDVSECALFGPSEFTAETASAGEGASVFVFQLGGPCLEFDSIVDITDWARYSIDGYPAVRIDAVAGDTRDRSYIVNLRPDVAPVMTEPRVIQPQASPPASDCEGGLGLWLVAREGWPGSFEENRAVLDRIAAMLRIGQP